ncbi:MAG: hypothetical protein AAGJ97_05245 [Planctomycetota bacterium]
MRTSSLLSGGDRVHTVRFMPWELNVDGDEVDLILDRAKADRALRLQQAGLTVSTVTPFMASLPQMLSAVSRSQSFTLSDGLTAWEIAAVIGCVLLMTAWPTFAYLARREEAEAFQRIRESLEPLPTTPLAKGANGSVLLDDGATVIGRERVEAVLYVGDHKQEHYDDAEPRVFPSAQYFEVDLLVRPHGHGPSRRYPLAGFGGWMSGRKLAEGLSAALDVPLIRKGAAAMSPIPKKEWTESLPVRTGRPVTLAEAVSRGRSGTLSTPA